MARRNNNRSRRSQTSNQRLRFDDALTPFDAEHQDDFFSPADLGTQLRDRLGWSPAPLNPAPARTFSAPTWQRNAVRQPTRPNGRNFSAAAVSPRVSPLNREENDPRTANAVQICVERRQREEILHALKKTGKGGQKRPVFTLESYIHCRRRK